MKLDDCGMDELRTAVDAAVDKLQTGGIVLAASATEGKVSLVCRLTADLVGKYKAGALIREVAKVVDGSGGGRDDMAQAGGKNPAKIDEALEKIYTLV
jgi:alanyl-tRNA synthetase